MEEGRGSTPYTGNEKLLLAALVEQHKDVLENKRTDSSTLQMKQRKWEQVTTAYNAQGNIISCQRTSVQLKKLWANLKQRKRRANTEYKYKTLVTGGGPPPVDINDPLMNAIEAAAPHCDVEVPCKWDSTAVTMANMDVPSESEDNAWEPQPKVLKSRENLIENLKPSTSTANMPMTPKKRDIGEPESKNTRSTENLENSPKPSRLTDRTPKRQNGSATLDIAKTEGDLRVKKLKDSIRQQEEIHQIKMAILQEEKLKASSEKIKAKAEAELAIGKLKAFKESIVEYKD